MIQRASQAPRCSCPGKMRRCTGRGELHGGGVEERKKNGGDGSNRRNNQQMKAMARGWKKSKNKRIYARIKEPGTGWSSETSEIG